MTPPEGFCSVKAACRAAGYGGRFSEVYRALRNSTYSGAVERDENGAKVRPIEVAHFLAGTGNGGQRRGAGTGAAAGARTGVSTLQAPGAAPAHALAPAPAPRSTPRTSPPRQAAPEPASLSLMQLREAVESEKLKLALQEVQDQALEQAARRTERDELVRLELERHRAELAREREEQEARRQAQDRRAWFAGWIRKASDAALALADRETVAAAMVPLSRALETALARHGPGNDEDAVAADVLAAVGSTVVLLAKQRQAARHALLSRLDALEMRLLRR